MQALNKDGSPLRFGQEEVTVEYYSLIKILLLQAKNPKYFKGEWTDNILKYNEVKCLKFVLFSCTCLHFHKVNQCLHITIVLTDTSSLNRPEHLT